MDKTKIFKILGLKSRSARPVITYVKTDFSEKHLRRLAKNPRHLSVSDEYSMFSCIYNKRALNFLGTGSGGASLLTALYELLLSDPSIIVRIGACGGLDNARIDDIVVCETSMCMDRISSRLVDQTHVSADRGLSNQIVEALNRDGIEAKRGSVASVDAMYLFEDDIRKAEEQGACCWDLETATLLAFGRRFGVRAASVLLVVSDNTGNSLTGYPPIQRIDFVKSGIRALTA